MSSVDKRVVQMVFDNDKFEKNIEQSRKSLESMDKTLNQVAENTNVEKLGNTIGDSLEQGVDKGIIKAEALRTVINSVVGSISSTVLGALHNIQATVNNLTFDQIGKGFDKYEEKLSSVQTILSATEKSGETLESVEETMEKLMWYTDETSYNFSDMANNIGKFTAVGVELETASSAMQGIANWAGLAGQKAQAASRAMYNISQAMSAGYMKQQDWASIQNANMDTKEFRETAYKTAKEMAEAGKYTELSLEWFEKNDYNAFFADLGKNKNFTTDVLIETLRKFSFYSDEIRRITEDENKTTIKAMDILGEISEEQVNELTKVYNEFGEGSAALQQEALALGISVESAANIAQAGWETFDLGRRAFEASQQYTTFKDVIDATTDAVSSLWMKIDQQIFGNLEEAKEFWTELGDIFYNIFATPIEKILEVFEAWNKFSGRKLLVGLAEDGEKVVSVFEQLVKNISSVVERIKEAFFEVNPFFEDSEQMGAALAYATNQLKEFLKTLQPTRQELLIIKDSFAFAFRILNGVFKVGYSIIKGAQIIVKAILPNMSELAKSLLPIFNDLNERGEEINQLFVDIANSIYRVAYFISNVIIKFKEALMNGTIKDFLVDLGKFLIAYAIYIIDKIIHPVEEELTGIPLLLYKVGNKVLEILRVIINVVANIVVPITSNLIIAIIEFINSGIGQKIVKFLDILVRTVLNLFILVINLGTAILEVINSIITGINKLFDEASKNEKKLDENTFIGGLSVALGALLMIVGGLMEEYKKGNITNVLGQLSDVFEGLGDAVDSFQKAINASALKNIAKSIMMLAASMLVIATIPQDRLLSSFMIVTFAVSGMLAVMFEISKSTGNGNSIRDILSFTKSLQALGTAMMLISVNIKMMAKESFSSYAKGLLIVAAEMVLIAQFVVMMMNATEPMKSVDVEAYKIQIENIGKMFLIIIGLAVAMMAFSGAIKLMGSLDVKQIIIGLVGYFSAVVGMILIIKEISKFFDNNAIIEDFSKKILALTGSMVIMTHAVIALLVPIAILGLMPQDIVISGLIDTVVAIATLLFAFNFVVKRTRTIDSKNILSLVGLIGALVIAVNALLGAFILFSLTPTEQFDQAISGIRSLIIVLGLVLIGLDFIFVILPRLLFRFEQTRNFEIISDKQAHAWANDFIRLGAALIMMAIAVSILAKATTSLAVTAGTFDIKTAFWTVVKLLGVIESFLLLQEFVQRVVIKDTELGKTMLLFALQITAIAAAIAALAYAFDKFANTIDENKIDSAIVKMVKSIGIVMVGILVVVAIVAILSRVLQKGKATGGGITKYLKLPGPKGEERVEKTTMSLGKEIVLFAAALMSFSLALSALMLPIFVLGGDAISEDDFKKASKRLVLLAAGLAGFIGALMLLYGVMGWITGGKAYGLSKKTTKNETGLREIVFGKGEYSSRISEMKGFGENIAEMSKSLLMIVGSILTLMLPLKILGNLNKNEFRQGLEGVVEMLLVVALTMSIMSLSMSDFSTAKVFGIGLIMISIFGVLTSILVRVQDVKEIVDQLEPAITVVAIIAAINAVILIIDKIRELIKKFKGDDEDEEEEEDAEESADKFLKIAGAFGIMAVSIGIIAGSLKLMSTVDLSWQQVAQLGSFFIAIGAFLAILGRMSTKGSAKKAEKETHTTETVIDDTTSVLTVIGDTIGDASEETEEIAEDSESIADNMMKIAGAFDIMAAGLVIIVGAFKLMETVKLTPGQIALLSAYAAVIAGYLIAVSLLVKDGDMVLKAAGAFGIIAASIVALAAGLKVLSTIDEIGTKAIVALSVIITIIGAIVVLFGIFGNPAMGGTILMAAGGLAIAFTSIALSILLVAAAAKVFTVAIGNLVKVAEESDEGWAAIQKGLDVFTELAVIIGIVVVVLGVLCGLFPPIAYGALLAAAAILAIAVALVGVLGLLYLIALAWPTLKENLDDLTDWLAEHEEDWATGIADFLATVITTLKTKLTEAGVEVDGSVGVMSASIKNLLTPITEVGNAFRGMFEMPQFLKDSGVKEGDSPFAVVWKWAKHAGANSPLAKFAEDKNNKEYTENLLESEAKRLFSEIKSEARNGKDKNINAYTLSEWTKYMNTTGGITTADLQKLYERFEKLYVSDKEKNGTTFDQRYRNFEEAYLQAGGRLFRNGRWLQNYNEEGMVLTESGKTIYDEYAGKNPKISFFAGIPIVDDKYCFIDGKWVKLNRVDVDDKGNEIIRYDGGNYYTGRKVTNGQYNLMDAEDNYKEYSWLLDAFYPVTEGAKITADNVNALSPIAEDVSSAAEAYGDGVDLTDVVTSDNTEATANNTQAVKTLTMSVEDFKLKYDRSGSTYVPSQKEIEAYEGSRTRGGNVWASMTNGDSKDVWSTIASIFGEGAKSYIDSDGDIFSFLTSWATSDKTGDTLTPAASKVEEGANKFLDWVNEVTGVDVKTSAMSKLQEYGLFKKKDENADNAEEEKSFLETIKDTAVSIYSGVKDGKSFGDAVKDALADNGLTLPQLEDSDLGKTLLESFGINLYDENGEIDFTKLMGDYKLPDIEKVKKELEEVAKVDTSDLDVENQVSDVSKQIEDAYKKYDFNYDDILKKYNVDPETFQNYGTDLGESLGLGQVEGYENAIKDNFSDISKQYSDLTSDAGYSSSSTSNLVWRGYDEKEGRDLYAPAMEEFRKTLVTPIREGWIWNGWNRKSKSDPLWLPDEKTQAKMDALKKTAEAVKESTDSTAASFEERSKSLKTEGKLLDGIDKESKWLFDDNTMEWTLVDKNGKPITKEDMEGNVSNVTKAGTKIGSKYGVNDSILKNGVWVYDEKNDEWTLFDSKTNKEMLTKTGDEGFIVTRKNPELKKSEYAVLKNREDLDMTKGVRKFDYKDSAGLPQKISDNKGHLYDAYGRKVKGYDNRYALTDKNGNLITGKNGNRIEFEVADDGTLRVLGEYNESAQIMKETAQTCVGLMSMGLGAFAKLFADNPEAAAEILKNGTTSDAVNTAAYAAGNAETTETTTQYSSVQNGDAATTTTTTNTKTSTASTSTTSQQTTQDAATVADRTLSNLRSMNQTLVQIKGKIDMMQENVRSTNDNTRFINNQLIQISKSESPVILDTQALVGRLLPLINQGLGQYTSLGSRRVTT